MNKLQIGYQAEKIALNYLLKHDLKLVTQNFRCRLGEIDLIMRDKKSLVFIEVRLRNHPNYATGLESVDRIKQNKLRKTAEFYLQQQQLTNKLACRFDVIAIEHNTEQPTISWVKNAF